MNTITELTEQERDIILEALNYSLKKRNLAFTRREQIRQIVQDMSNPKK